MSGTAFLLFKVVFTILLVVFVIAEFGTFRTKSWVIKVIILMALCYPLGKAIEFWHISPEFVRGHLSDFGFVPCLAWFAMQCRPFTKMETWRAWLVTSTSALGIAVFFEFVEIGYQQLEIAKHAPTRGDPIDMACYFLSYALLLVVARIQVRKLRAFDARAAARQTALAEQTRDTARTELRQSPARTPRPNQRPGGRGRRSKHQGRR